MITQCADEITGTRLDAAVSGNNHRMCGGLDHRGQFGNRSGSIVAGAGWAGKMNLLEHRFINHFLLDVVGNAQQNRSRLIGKQGLGRLV